MNNNRTSETLINGEVHNDLCVGIDLGTTNSVISIINQKPNGELVSKVVDIPRAINRMNSSSVKNRLEQQKRNTLPSCVYYNDENNYQPIVGDFAKDQYSLRPHLVAKSIKSQMGEENVSGLSENIPDKTPAKVSARILNHLLRCTESIYKCGEIKDAIITVPANFDSSMCAATIEAAEIAGIVTKNKDGSDRPILLSEPNAAIYDFINQANNGEITNTLLDLSSPKQVMVFDLGGGTLDITLHNIKKRGENMNTYKVDEIATNRYTRLGGDDFDKAIAEEMFRRFLSKYPDSTIQHQLKNQKESLMPKFVSWAEELKKEINMNDEVVFDSNWDDDESEEKMYSVGGNTGSNFSYDDDFRKGEVEAILERFMGRELAYSNYRNMEGISDTNNIIYPILDVLAKGAAKQGVDDIKIDAVILNGGMSRFYMIKQRLEEFFGFEPISILDPDLAVARGAAVYHHYLHKDAYLQDDMRIIAGSERKDNSMTSSPKVSDVVSSTRIEWGAKILNDALYLGLKGGAVKDIIPTGATLPYDSEIMHGFKLQPNTNCISVPIKSKNIDGTYRTISTGIIEFDNKYPNGAFVAFKIHMDVEKRISMTAWTSADELCTKVIDTGSVTISIGDKTNSATSKPRIVSPKGTPVVPNSCISTVLQLCKNKECKNVRIKQAASKKLKEAESEIINCSNKKDFAPVILQKLSEDNRSYLEKERLFVLARKIGFDWSADEKKKLASLCLKHLSPIMTGMDLGGVSVNANVQAIFTLGMCGSFADVNLLVSLRDMKRYYQACLYVHGKTRTQIPWVLSQFEKDYEDFNMKYGNNLQFSVYAIGNALRKDGTNFFSGINEDDVVEKICDLLRSDISAKEYFVPCVIALGLICDTRVEKFVHKASTFRDVHNLLLNIEDYCRKNESVNLKCKDIALKMIDGFGLTDDEERFLLEKIEVA